MDSDRRICGFPEIAALQQRLHKGDTRVREILVRVVLNYSLPSWPCIFRVWFQGVNSSGVRAGRDYPTQHLEAPICTCRIQFCVGILDAIDHFRVHHSQDLGLCYLGSCTELFNMGSYDVLCSCVSPPHFGNCTFGKVPR